jgi:cytoplasmic iron level regulating protein YaaA (DUF328/UPF0246 family)
MEQPMRKIVLISCVSKKQTFTTRAEQLYISPLFKLNLQFARLLNPDQIYILSAKYGVISLEDEIEPYDETLNTKNTKEIKQWAEQVVADLNSLIDMNNDEVIFLAGDKYRKYIIPHLKNYRIPLQGLTIGRQLQFLNQELKKRDHHA